MFTIATPFPAIGFLVLITYANILRHSKYHDPLQIGLNSVACGSFQGPVAMESEVLTFMMDGPCYGLSC